MPEVGIRIDFRAPCSVSLFGVDPIQSDWTSMPAKRGGSLLWFPSRRILPNLFEIPLTNLLQVMGSLVKQGFPSPLFRPALNGLTLIVILDFQGL